VIDSQLQEAIFDFERQTGVVATIKGEGSSKSGELAFQAEMCGQPPDSG
jgi:type I restriction enzyme R subunit